MSDKSESGNLRRIKQLKWTKYIVKRLLATIPILFGLLIIIFLMIHQRDSFIELYRYSHDQGNFIFLEKVDLSKPIFIQFIIYLSGLFRGDWGLSYVYNINEPVLNLIARTLPVTMDILIFSLLISTFLGITFGIRATQHKNEIKQKSLHFNSQIIISFLIFIFGLLLKALFTKDGFFGVFPAKFLYPKEDYPPLISGFFLIDSLLVGKFKFTLDYLTFISLPVICLSSINLASITYKTRNSMINVLNQDYIRTARAKGCQEKVIIKKHALKNTLSPVVGNLKFNIGTMLSGVIFVEYVFDIDGLGTLLLNSLNTYDLWLIQGVCFVFIILFVATKFVSEIIHGFLNPSIL